MTKVIQADIDAAELIFLHFRAGRPERAIEAIAAHRERAEAAIVAWHRSEADRYRGLATKEAVASKPDEHVVRSFIACATHHKSSADAIARQAHRSKP